MRRLTISILALLTAFSAMASGALNGRVLCVAGADHLAIEDPHGAANDGDVRHCNLERAARSIFGDTDPGRTSGQVDLNSSDRDSDGCVDVESSGTLVREVATPAFENVHTPLPLAHLPSSRSTALLVLDHCPARADVAGGKSLPPTDPVGLRVIVLLT